MTLVRFARLFIAVALVAGSGCHDSPSTVPATSKCLLNSECNGSLICVQRYCVNACVKTKDCPANQRCIAAEEGLTCQAPERATCSYNSDCTRPLICSGDMQCRHQCQTDVDCPTAQICTAISKLCADPLLDKAYDPTIKDFTGASAAFGAGRIDPGSNGDGGIGDGGVGDGSIDAPAAGPDAEVAISCPGQSLTNFGKIAVGDSNPRYTSGIGVRTADEMLIFNGYSGLADPPDAGVDAGTPPFINRIDVQRFDLTGKKKGPPALLAVVEGGGNDGVNMAVNGAAVAPTGRIAVAYSAGLAQWGIYLAFLEPGTLKVAQTVQLQSIGGSRFGRQTHVQWEDGQFVASWVSYVGGKSYANLAKFDKDGNATGSTSPVPSDQQGPIRNDNEVEQASVAFSGTTFAVAYSSNAKIIPSLTFLDRDGNQVGQTLKLPYSELDVSPDYSRFVSVAATPQGFVALYNGQVTADAGAVTGFATLATFVSPNGIIGTTYALNGAAAYNAESGSRAASDGTGAGFAVLTTDGKATFFYVTGDGSKRLGPLNVISQINPTVMGDEPHLMNVGGSFGISLYSQSEHLTRMAVSGCPPK